MIPNPVQRPLSVGTIHGMSLVKPVHPNLRVVSQVFGTHDENGNYQKIPTLKATPPMIASGRRHSGIGILLLAANLRL